MPSLCIEWMCFLTWHCASRFHSESTYVLEDTYSLPWWQWCVCKHIVCRSLLQISPLTWVKSDCVDLNVEDLGLNSDLAMNLLGWILSHYLSVSLTTQGCCEDKSWEKPWAPYNIVVKNSQIDSPHLSIGFLMHVHLAPRWLRWEDWQWQRV